MNRQRFLALALIVAVSIGLAEAADALGRVTGVGQLEDATLDSRQTTTRETFVPTLGERESDVVLVLFDEYSVMDDVDGWDWIMPASRADIADVIDALAAAGARTIGLDVFLDRLYPKLNALDQGDERLRDAIDRAGNVILVNPVVQGEDGPVSAPPLPYFEDVAAGVGTAELPSAFETFRDGTLAIRGARGLEPSFALALYTHYVGVETDSLLLASRRRGRVALPGIPESVGRIPDDWFEEGAGEASTIVPFKIRFAGPRSTTDAEAATGTFQASGSAEVPLLAMIAPEFFEDKIVLVGTGWHDSDKFRTPFYSLPIPGTEAGTRGEQYGWMFGVEIHANAVQNMIDEEYVRPLEPGSTLLILLVITLLNAGVTFSRGTAWGGFTTLVTTGGVLAGAWWAWAGYMYGPSGEPIISFGGRFVWVPVVVPVLAGLISYVSSVGYTAIVEGREKRFIKGAFGKYVSPEVVNDIASDPGALQLGGQKRPLSVFFSDLAGFTTLSERLDPQELVAKLNEYLTEMTQVVMDERGTLDKYIGDAIMAFWNAPTRLEDHPDRALRAMIFTQRKMDELNQRWREEDPEHEELIVRCGVNTGEVVVGNVGGTNRFDYSAIGDAVNLAARLEPANKSYDTLNMCSEFTLLAADAPAYRVRELDYMVVKGKEEPVKVFEVLELAGVELAPDKEQALTEYAAGLVLYKQHDWKGARARFAAAVEACPADGPSRVYRDRCDENIADPPPPDWDFVVRRTTK